MGNNNSELTEAQFRQQWQTLTQINGRNIWQNKQNPSLKLEQYIVGEDQVEKNPKLNEIRKKSNFVVGAHSLKKDGFSCQMDNDAKKLFVEHTVLRLSALRDIPYPDIFHLYDVFIHGYGQLTKEVDYFSVDEEQVGINEIGQAKVWLSNQFQSNKISGIRVTESKMVSDMLSLLQSKTYNATRGKYPNIAQYIQNHEKITFQEATAKFVEYVRTFSEGEVPTRLTYLNLNTLGTNQSLLGTVENRNSQSYGAATSAISRQPSQIQQELGVATNLSFDRAQKSSQPVPPTVSTSQQIFSTPSYINTVSTPAVGTPIISTPVASTRVSQPYQSTFVVPPGQQYQPQEVFNRPLKTQTIVSSSTTPITPVITFGSRPTTSFKLARTLSQNISTQSLTQFNQNTVGISSQPRFVPASNIYAPPQPQPVPVQVIQRPLPVQSVIQQAQTADLKQTPTVISQSSIPSYNQPVQVVQSVSVNETRAVPLEVSKTSKILETIKGVPTIEYKGDVVTTSYPSQTADLATVSKVAESEVRNVAAGTSTQKNALKGSETIDWQDYTNKGDTNKGFSKFDRHINEDYDARLRMAEPSYTSGTTKFTPESDGKSSPEFLALLSQIKSGIGQTSGLSQNYSYSGSKNEGSYGSFETSKFSSNYVSSNYFVGLDPELHADLQKYKQ